MGGADASQLVKPISKAVVHRICSGQVILDLSSAVKELVENSLDAGATIIEINLNEYGEKSFKVIDNGCGISPENFQVLALKHHTSKISEFSDLHSLRTFGFRGEALSSLCTLGDLIIETRTKNESLGTHLVFDHSGVVKTERKIARQVGTTVSVDKLFSTLPVRSKDFSRNIRREYAKLVSLLNAYALTAKGVRLLCTNTTGKNSKSVLLKTQGNGSLKDNIIAVFGLSTFQCLDPLTICVYEGCKVEGFISKPRYGCGRSLGDRQYFFVNGRPVDMPKISKLFNELFRYSNSKQFPIVILNFTIPAGSYDVNVTPDKRKIFFTNEDPLMITIRAEIEKIYCLNECKYAVNRIEEPEKETDMELSYEDGRSQTSLKCSSVTMLRVTEIDQDKGILPCEESPLPKELINTALEVKEPAGPSYHLKQSSDFLKTFKIDGKTINHAGDKGILPCEESPLPKELINTALEVKEPAGPSYHLKQSSDFLKTFKIDGKTINHAGLETGSNSPCNNFVQSSLTKYISQNKRKHENSCAVLSEMPVLRNEASYQVRKTSPDIQVLAQKPREDVPKDDSREVNAGELLQNQVRPDSSSKKDDFSSCELDIHHRRSNEQDSGACGEHVSPSDVTITSCKDVQVNEGKHSSLNPSSEPCGEKYESLKPGSRSSTYSVMQFNLDDLRRKAKLKLTKFGSSKLSCGGVRHYNAATVDNLQSKDNDQKVQSMDAATRELDRLFRKEYFAQLQVIGQFNLGFIIGKMDQDLFIIDQHAADEKYNFERLSRSTILNLQPLLKPLKLELSPEEEVIVSTNMQIIRKNGFSLIEDMQAPPGHRFLLKAVPFSKNMIFGAEDVKELISILADSHGESGVLGTYKMDTSDSICPSRVRDMLASRACRSSVMIGDSLTKIDMQRILCRMADLNSPWNCPHGRPTMRHLADLAAVYYARLEKGDVGSLL